MFVWLDRMLKEWRWTMEIILAFGSGIGFAFIVILIGGYFSEKKPFQSPPLNKELIDFWQKSIIQKDVELNILRRIADRDQLI